MRTRVRQRLPLVLSEAVGLAEKCLGGSAGAHMLFNLGGKFVRHSKQVIGRHTENRTQEDNRVGRWWWQSTVFHFSAIREIQASALCQLTLGQTDLMTQSKH